MGRQMDGATVLTVVTSAGIGSLVSAGLILLNAHLERRARREELLLSKAIDLAQERINLALAVARENKDRMRLPDATFMAVDYFRWLRHLLRHGELPADIKPEWDAWLRREKARAASPGGDRAGGGGS
jgi:hypothetical protein